MSSPNTLLLSSAFSPRHRPLEIRATFSISCPFCTINAAMNTKQNVEILSIGQIWNKKRVFNWKRSHAFSPVLRLQTKVLLHFSKSSSVPCSLPLCFYSNNMLNLAHCLLRSTTGHQSLQQQTDSKGSRYTCKERVQNSRNSTFSRITRNFWLPILWQRKKNDNSFWDSSKAPDFQKLILTYFLKIMLLKPGTPKSLAAFKYISYSAFDSGSSQQTPHRLHPPVGPGAVPLSTEHTRWRLSFMSE